MVSVWDYSNKPKVSSIVNIKYVEFVDNESYGNNGHSYNKLYWQVYGLQRGPNRVSESMPQLAPATPIYIYIYVYIYIYIYVYIYIYIYHC